MSHIPHPNIQDKAQREFALNHNLSFIVQAPAGSGKTSLLVQRYLALLSRAQSPEEIIAITFTRKAKSEMLRRLLEALKNAHELQDGEKNKIDDPFTLKTIGLAEKVLERDRKLSWNIMENHHRIFIQTIDSMCHKIARQSPITSSSVKLNIGKDSDINQCYHQASLNFIKDSLQNKDSNYYKHVTTLLLHLDNDITKIMELCTTMLKCREEWLPYIINCKNTQNLRQNIEAGLFNVTKEHVETCQKLFPKETFLELSHLAKFAANNFKNNVIPLNPGSKISDLSNLPESVDDLCLEDLIAISELLMTKDNSWRSTVNSAQGFPSQSSSKEKSEQILFYEMKESMKSLISVFREHENLRESLENLSLLPPLKYGESQWEIVEALLELLPFLVAELKVVFNENAISDYTEISLEAQSILGGYDSPSDIGLHLDQKIKHILIDEFQDTSYSQYRLLEKLTLGWNMNDERTLFVVGDPMQSIYRFRNAEVGIFLRLKQEGINGIKLHPLTLTTNFRSLPGIVKWVNDNLSKVLPENENINHGAVQFSQSSSAKGGPDRFDNVKIEIFAKEKAIEREENKINNGEKIYKIGDETDEIIRIINNINQKTQGKETIAILARTRHHLRNIIPRLKIENIPYQAVDLDALNNSIAIRDLFSLTTALLCLVDRIAWLSILRAPWCGLQLKDIFEIANGKHKTIYENICSYDSLSISQDAKIKLEKFVTVIKKGIQNRYRKPLRDLIENTWIELEGKLYLDEFETSHPHIYFELLEENEHTDLQKIKTNLTNLYAPPPLTCQEANLHIMTIHKAKGMEFDNVIIPSLNETTRNDESKLLLWQEHIRLHGGSDFLLAPIKNASDKEDQIYNYLKFCEKRKNHYETGRLLYVATTRAKKSLYLIGTDESTKEGSMESPKTKVKSIKGNASFLDLLSLTK